MKSAVKSTSQVMDKVKTFLRPKRREESNPAAADRAPVSLGNSRQDQSLEIPKAAGSPREVPHSSLEGKAGSSHLEQDSTIVPRDNVPSSEETTQNNPDPNPVIDAKEALGDHASPSSDQEPSGLTDPTKGNTSLETPEVAAPIDEKVNEIPNMPSLRSQTSVASSRASREQSPFSMPLWTLKTYSETLWNLAYEILREENGKAIEQYESVILTCVRAAEENEQEIALGRLHDIIQSNESKIVPADFKSPLRSPHMSSFLEFFLKSPVPTEPSDNSMTDDTNSNANESESDYPLSLMSELEAAIHKTSYAHTPWVASCFAIEVSSHAI
ncbi:putative WD-40 repeat protein [Fusarium bulbicola]|nr:putative WD-40 repeat protein [Fusarium bulbicola]